MAINLTDIRQAVLDYFSSLLVPSISIAPASGTEVNPDEQFNVTLTVKNSAANAAKGIQIDDFCFHVSVDDFTKALLIAPSTSVAVARESSSSSSSLVDPGRELAQLFLFPSDDILESGEQGSVTIQGRALAAGMPKLTMHVHGKVDLDYLLIGDQKSANTSQSVSIKN